MSGDRTKSAERVAAGRLNGPKAKGTKTPEGKSGYALNAVKHGLGAKRIVLANEVHRNFDRLLNVFFERFQPIDEVECELVTDIVMAKWRHRRACCIEAAMVDQQLAKDRPQQDLEYSVLTEDIRCALAYQAVERESGFISAVNRQTARVHREFRYAIKLLLEIQANRSAPAAPQNTVPNEGTKVPGEPPPHPLPSPQKTLPNEGNQVEPPPPPLCPALSSRLRISTSEPRVSASDARDSTLVQSQIHRRARPASKLARGRALIDHNLDVSSAAHNGKRLTRGTVGERGPQMVNALQPNRNLERPRLDGPKLDHMQVRDQVSEAVGFDHRAGPRRSCDTRGLQRRKLRIISDLFAKACGLRTSRQVGGARGKDIAAVEGPANLLQKIPLVGDRAHLVLRGHIDHRQHAVIGRNKILSCGLYQNGPALGPHARIHDNHVHRPLGEIAIGLRNRESALDDLKRGDFMSDINDPRAGGDPQDNSLHDPGEMVGQAEIGRESDDHRGKLKDIPVPRYYFDHNATTPVSQEVLDAFVPALAEVYGNASSIHQTGQAAKQKLDAARRDIAEFLRCGPKDIVLTSGGTESDNLAVLGAVRAHPQNHKHVVTTVIEHPAVLKACAQLEREGVQVSYVAVGSSGVVDPADILGAMRSDTVLVSVMHANNEIGTVQPVQEISAITHEHGALFHSDGVQATGKIPINVTMLGVDLYSISGHKMQAPKGTGALFVRKGVKLAPLLHGGRHENGMRAGTENVAGAVALGRAASWLREQQTEVNRHISGLRDRLERGILERVACAHLNCGASPRVPNTTNIRFEAIEGEPLLIALDLRGFAVSSGAACSSGAVEPSHVLTAIGLAREQARSCLRFSLGRSNTAEQVDALIEAVTESVAQLRRISTAVPTHV
jgi:cysteine desulfurase